MSELSFLGKLLKAIDIAKQAQVGIELSYFDVLSLSGEINSLKEVIAMQGARIAELEAAQRWIPVSERLPELYEKVIVFNEGGYMKVDFLCHMRGDFMYSDMKVTHWMPLPESPNDTQTQTFVYGKEDSEVQE